MSIEEDLMRAEPPSDPLAVRLIQARLEKRLAGVGQGAPTIGRFQVLEQVGAGAHGAVYAAYDPKLDRRVALKILRRDTAPGERRLIREARAMAKLAHPNIVAVYDVTEADGELFVAMEFVEGPTLEAWLADGGRSIDDVLDVLRSAGRGLAEAHAQGLVHRDFKPSNVLVGADGRTRVTDFGLALAPREGKVASLDPAPTDEVLTATATGAIIGTPLYMAPEQHRGEPADARSDQYSFCLTVWEALTGRHPLAEPSPTPAESAHDALARAKQAGPAAWMTSARAVPPEMARALLRGLAPAPDERWPSLNALLAEMEPRSGPTSHRSSVVWAGLALATIGGTVAVAETVRRQDLEQKTAACAAAGESIAEVWADAEREGLRVSFRATGAPYASQAAEKVIPLLDDYVGSWSEHRAAACMNHTVRETWSAETFEAASWCLDERRLELLAAVAELQSADGQSVYKAVQLAAGLPPPTPCSDLKSLSRAPDPPPPGTRAEIEDARRDVARARSLLATGRYAEGLAVAQAARQRADAASWAPLAVSARLVEASLLDHHSESGGAEATARRAYIDAAEAGSWESASRAATLLVQIVGVGGSRFDEARIWADQGEVALAHAGDPTRWLEANLARSLGNLSKVEGKYEDARGQLERALSIYESTLGAEHPALSAVLHDLAAVHVELAEFDDATVYAERSLDAVDEALGPEHPNVGVVLTTLGNVCRRSGKPQEAERHFERAVEVTYGADDSALAEAWNNLGTAREELGEHDTAREAYEQALAAWRRSDTPEHPGVGRVLTNLGILHGKTGDFAESKALQERALAIMEAALGAEHPGLAIVLNNLGTASILAGDPEAARAAFTRSLAIREATLGPDHPRLALTLHNLGRVEEQLGDDRAAARYFQRALEIYESRHGAQHPNLVDTLFGLGTVFAKLGDFETALTHRERTVTILLATGGTALAGARYGLAKALWDAPVSQGRDRVRARALAEQARDVYAADGEASSDSLAFVEDWLTAHRPQGGR